MITLEKMTDEQRKAFQEIAISTYAHEIAQAKAIGLTDATILARNEFDFLCKEGRHAEQCVFNTLFLDSTVIGFIWYEINNATAYIYDIFIYEDYRNKGYGSKVLEKLQATLKKQQVKHIELNVFAHNQKAIAFYQRLNFTTECYTMTKKIS